MKQVFPKKRKDDAPNRRRQDAAAARQQSAAQASSSFRRNRTLTGSSSASVSSSNELNAELLSPRAHVHHLTKKRRHLFGRFVIIVVLALVTYLLVNQLVANVTVTGGSLVDIPTSKQQGYQHRIDQYYAGHIGERFYPALNDRDLTTFLQAKYPEVASLDVAMSGEFGKAIAQVKLRRPVARWVINGHTECVDSSGVVLDYNAYSAPKLTIVDTNHYPDSTGNLVASHRFLAFVGQVVGDAKREGLTVTKATLPLLTTRQLEVRFKHVGYHFKLTVDRSAGEQMEDAARIVHYLKRKHITPKYVDVRVKGKAFYK